MLKKTNSLKKTKVEFYDPFVKKIEINGKKMKSIKLNYQKLKKYDSVIILTNHSNINYNLIYKLSRKIIDTRMKSSKVKGNSL